MRFGVKSPPWNSHELTYPQPKSHPGPTGPQKVDFCSRNHFLAQKCILGAKVHFWRQSALFAKNALLRPHAADAYQTNGFLMKMEPLLAQKRILAKKCISGPKIDFWAQKAKMAPKCVLGPKSAFFEKVTKKLTTASALRIENRDSRIRARTASTGGRGS